MQLEEKYVFDYQASFPPSTSFPGRALCKAGGETGFCEQESHTQSRSFGQGAIIHVAHMLTNTLMPLLRQWQCGSEHISAKNAPGG